MTEISERRDFLKLGMSGVALAGAAGTLALAGGAVLATAQQAAAQASSDSLLRTIIDRGHLIVGTGSTNAPWHFEDESGKLVGMDITMAKILAKGLFDDDTKVEFVLQDPAQRIPNIVTGKVDITIQFMTMSANRAQLVAFARPYYIEGVSLLSTPSGTKKSFDELLSGGANTRISILQNVGAEEGVHKVLPEAQVMQIDTQANVIAALEAGRVDGAAVDLSTVKWLVARNPEKYADSGKAWESMLYGAALRQGDLDWLHFVSTTFEIAMFGNDNALYDAAFLEYFGTKVPDRKTGFPAI